MILLISLAEVTEGRVWCPFSGRRTHVPGTAFAADCCCIGPRCAVWAWQSDADASDRERRRRHLVPPHFSPSHRVRLVSQLLPALLAPFQQLAQGAGDQDGARVAILAWAGSEWRPEADMPDPDAWQRVGEPFWDREADTPALDLIRALPDERRLGRCCGTGVPE